MESLNVAFELHEAREIYQGQTEKQEHNLKNLCLRCPHGKSRETCIELCPEAQAYADQDWVGRRENLIMDLVQEDRSGQLANNEDCTRNDQELMLTAKALDAEYNSLTYQEMVAAAEAVQLGDKEWIALARCTGLNFKELLCLKMYFWEHKRQAQIAKVLKISQQAVGGILKRAKKKALPQLLALLQSHPNWRKPTKGLRNPYEPDRVNLYRRPR